MFNTLVSGVLMVFVIGIAGGVPDGYNYQKPENSIFNGIQYLPLSGGPLNEQAYQHEISSEHQFPSQQPPQTSESYDKEIYTFSAPEDHFDDENAAHKIAAGLDKKLRIIFIKSPENKGFEKAALALAQHAVSDKTAIFVLNKQADIQELAGKFSSLRNQHHHKPEVHFVKYRTAEEAAHAQHQIQAQYDSLQGPLHISHEANANVLDYASKPSHSGISQQYGTGLFPTSDGQKPVATSYTLQNTGGEVASNVIGQGYQYVQSQQPSSGYQYAHATQTVGSASAEEVPVSSSFKGPLNLASVLGYSQNSQSNGGYEYETAYPPFNELGPVTSNYIQGTHTKEESSSYSKTLGPVSIQAPLSNTFNDFNNGIQELGQTIPRGYTYGPPTNAEYSYNANGVAAASNNQNVLARSTTTLETGNGIVSKLNERSSGSKIVFPNDLS